MDTQMMKTARKALGSGLVALTAQLGQRAESEVMKTAVADINAAADKADPLEIPTFLRRADTPEEKKAREKTAAEIKKGFRTPITETSKAKPLAAKGNVEASIKSEAEDRWRNWIPSRDHPKRPPVRAFIKIVRAEFKAAAEKTRPTGDKIGASEKTKTPAKPKIKKHKESTVRKNSKTASKAKTSKAKKTSTPKTNASVRPGSKLEKIVKMLTRPEGCTTADVLKATEWPAVSMPQQAKAAGLTLKKEKDGNVTRYRAA